MATGALKRKSYRLPDFVAEEPEYHADRHLWWVVFLYKGHVFDNDLVVVINDRNSKTCMQNTAAYGPCT